MAVPNPECKSFTTWRGVSAHRSRQKVVEASRPSFISRHNIYVPAELREVLQPKVEEVPQAPAAVAAPKVGASTFSPDDVQAAIAAAQSAERGVWRDATTAIRKALSKTNGPPIQAVVDSGVLPRLVEFVRTMGQDPDLQLEAAWALCNVASGTSAQCEAVVAAGAVPAALPLLQSPRADLREQAAWLLGNIAGDGLALRDRCLEAGLMPPLLRALREETQDKAIQQLAWLTSNVLRWKPRPDKAVRDALPVLLAAAVRKDVNDEVLTDVMWALAYASDHDPDAFPDTAGCAAALQRAAELLDRPKAPKSLVSAIVRFVSQLTTGGEPATAAVIDGGFLAAGFKRILAHSEVEPHVSDVLFALSNTVATKQLDYQAKAVADAGLIPLVVDGIRQQVKPRPRREAVHTLANLTMFPKYAPIAWECGAIEALVDFLTQPQLMSHDGGSVSKGDSSAAKAAMEGLIGFAEVGKELAGGDADAAANPVLSLFASARLYERLQEARDAGELPRSALRDLEKLLQNFPPPAP
ncbi:hypothetical protein HXX76_013998 [Chlamydomonas incerta]|uniref:Importin subunit alpha n=1 Tax=Chlamydomonas incerta TaxID=51695 RepID=A0A835SMR4_CHLIN|nr:hypothetical protein HXX76_013998 [Chlamydomonas incerta]|eukprot:KAG2425089.1 hypothetical protein HXX76_013998 [Chlamydomonas incerta]